MPGVSKTDGWVLLMECHDVAELHALRAALEARGVPCQIHGEHTHGIMGAFNGGVARSRVLVPAPALELARTLVQDIVGPFDEQAADEPDDPEESPFRRQGERTPTPAGDHEPDDPPTPALKSYARLVLVVFLGLGPFLGLGHLYAGRNTRAGLLLLATLLATPAALSGAWWARWMLAGVWLTDVIGGALGIAAHNRRVQAATPRVLAGATPQQRAAIDR